MPFEYIVNADYTVNALVRYSFTSNKLSESILTFITQQVTRIYKT